MSKFKIAGRLLKNAAIGATAGAAGGYGVANIGFKKEGAKEGAVVGGVIGAAAGVPASIISSLTKTFVKGLKATPSSKVGSFFRRVDQATASAASGARKVSGAAKTMGGKVRFIRVRGRVVPIKSVVPYKGK